MSPQDSSDLFQKVRQGIALVTLPRLTTILAGLLLVAFALSAGQIVGAPGVQAQSPTATPLPAPPDLILDGGQRVELGGEHVFGDVILLNRSRLEIKPYSGRDSAGQLVIRAERVILDRTSSIIGSERGYRGLAKLNGEGPGGGEGGRNTFDGGAGGAYGGNGGDGVLDGQGRAGSRGGRSYGKDCDEEVEPGSAGGAPGSADNSSDPGRGGNGGAALSIIADTVIITGSITLNGEDGMVSANDSGGGGAGGGLMIMARHLQFEGRVEADGGIGAVSDDGGGGGGGGRVKMFYVEGDVQRRGITVNGGRGDGNGYPNDGRRGSVCIQVIPPTPTPVLSPTPSATNTPTPSDTPALSVTPTPTATQTPSVTPSATSTHTPSATSTPTPLPADLYLPLLLKERCPKAADRPLAIVLVLDASTSMEGLTRAGRSKMDAALEAARVPVDLVSRSPSSQLALVSFNARATRLIGLSRDQASLQAALEQLRIEPGSRLDEGVDLAFELLQDQASGIERRIVIVTDGRPSPSTPEEALFAAERARSQGIIVDTIGLGQDLDPELLQRMASSPERYHPAPDAEDLDAIFADLAWQPLPCNGTPVWPR